jgi:hypothetical protein
MSQLAESRNVLFSALIKLWKEAMNNLVQICSLKYFSHRKFQFYAFYLERKFSTAIQSLLRTKEKNK